MQLVREEREKVLLKQSFTSDTQIRHELNEIAGTTGNATYGLQHVVTFLRRKHWLVEAKGINTIVEISYLIFPHQLSLKLTICTVPCGCIIDHLYFER